MYEIKKPVKYSTHFGVTISILTFSAIIAFIFPQIINFISIIGGYGCTLYQITIPGLCYYKLNGPFKTSIIILTFILTFFGFFASTLSLFDSLGIIDLSNY